MVSSFVRFQKSIQEKLMPGKLLYVARRNHEEIEKWTFGGSVEEAITALKGAAASHKNFDFVSEDIGKGFLKLSVLTPTAKWLDILEISLKPSDNETIITARAYSSGVLPLIIPLAPILNCVLFFVPFGDGGKCMLWLQKLRNHADVKPKITKVDVVQKSWSNFEKRL